MPPKMATKKRGDIGVLFAPSFGGSLRDSKARQKDEGTEAAGHRMGLSAGYSAIIVTRQLMLGGLLRM